MRRDSFGHHAGDLLLQTVAEWLRKCVRSIDTVSRLGGDEFVIMLIDIGSRETVAHVADNVLAAFNLPHRIDSHAFTISTCIGISIFPQDGDDIDSLLRHADLAMYAAKQRGANCYHFYGER